MAFESGRKWGLIGSLIYVIVPVATIALYVLSFLSLFGIAPKILQSLLLGSPSLPGISIANLMLGIVGIIGLVMFLVAMRSLSQYYNEPIIFKKTWTGFLISLITVALLVGAVVAISLASVFRLSIMGPGLFLGIFGIGIVGFAIAIITATFYKSAFQKLAEKSGVISFNSAGSLYLTGTVLTIILVGAIIVWIAWVEALSGFYSLKPKSAELPTASYPPPQPLYKMSFEDKKFCIYCGEEISLDSDYCTYCGRQQH